MAQYPLIYFLRHGQTDWNVSGRIQGQINRDINDVGRAQATSNGHKLAALIGKAQGFDFVASPLRRTCETMERIRTAMGFVPENYRTDPLLMELNFGNWQGYTEAEINAEAPEQIGARHEDKWNFLPSSEYAESYAMLEIRFKSWLDTVQQKTVCVTHGGCIRTLFHLFGNLSEKSASNHSIPQDHILRFEDGELDWL